MTGLYLVAYFGVQEAVNSLLNRYSPDLKDSNGQIPLLWATEYRHEIIVKLLLKSERVNTNSKSYYGWTLLAYTTKNSHTTIIKLLLNTSSINANYKPIRNNSIGPPGYGEYNQTLLLWATGYRHEIVVKLLLESSRVNTDSKSYRNWTPLAYATIIKLLLNTHNININVKLNNYSVKWPYSENGYKSIFHINAESKAGHSHYARIPLLYAVEQGHKAVIRMLLNTGKVNTNSKGDFLRMPLSYTAQRGHGFIIKQIISINRVNMDSRARKNKRMPLLYAAENGHELVIK
jgi:ankyrin repeat protein